MVVDLDTERQIVRLARAQHGVVTWLQLLDAGLTPAGVRARVSRGALWRLFHGVYTTADPALLPLARESAALLSLGPGAVLSHRSAAAAWEIAAREEPVHVSVLGRKPRSRPGVHIHLPRRLKPQDIRTRHNLRLTSPARTLIDFGAQANSSELQQAFGDARAQRLLTDRALNEALARASRNHPGAALIRAMLGADPDTTNTRSENERRLRRLLKAAGLPQPLANRLVHGYLVDFVWPQAKLILEIDAYGTHGHPGAFESDRKRDQVHIAAGYTVIRVTWRQLRDEPLAVIARIAQALARRAA
jgi:very-short-patch-repair endonuclease